MDWSSDDGSSDLAGQRPGRFQQATGAFIDRVIARYDRMLQWVLAHQPLTLLVALGTFVLTVLLYIAIPKGFFPQQDSGMIQAITQAPASISFPAMAQRQEAAARIVLQDRSEEHTSELQSLMRISYAVFCLKKKKKRTTTQ